MPTIVAVVALLFSASTQAVFIPEIFYDHCSLHMLTESAQVDKLRQLYSRILKQKKPEVKESELLFQASPEQTLNDIGAYQAIWGYTDSEYEILNDNLVKNLLEEMNPKLQDSYLFKARLIEELKSLKEYSGQTFSGAAMKSETLEKYLGRTGDEIEIDYFMSTSLKSDVAEEFMLKGMEKHKNQRIPVLFTVNGKTGRSIQAYSKYPKEAEVLFMPTTFKVVSERKATFRTKNGTNVSGYVIELSEVYRPKLHYEKLEGLKKQTYRYDLKVNKRRFSSMLVDENSAAFKNWLNAHEEFVVQASDQPVSVKNLKKMHAMIMKDEVFHGARRRRIRQRVDAGDLSMAQAVDELMKETVPGTEEKLSIFAGKFREEDLDHFVHDGDLLDSDAKRYISYEELPGMLANPYLRMKPQKVVHTDDGQGIYATFHYLPPSRIEESVDKALRAFTARSKKDYLRAVTILYKELMTIHPFQDGNGRTVRLFIDMLLAKKNYPLPLRLLGDEYSDSVDGMLKRLVRAMAIKK